MQAREVMSRPVVTVSTIDQHCRCCSSLITHGFTALPVLDGDDRLVGIVTEADLIRDRIPPDPRPAPRVATRPRPGHRTDGELAR